MLNKTLINISNKNVNIAVTICGFASDFFALLNARMLTV